MAVCCLALSGGVEAAGNKKSGKAPAIPSDVSLGFTGSTREQLLTNIKRVGILPVELPETLRDRDDARRVLQNAVATYLRAAHFEVIGPATYLESFDRLNRERGGMYDVATGELKPEVGIAVREGARAEFASKEQLDGFIFLRVQPTVADCLGYYATWDGVHERSDGKGPPNSVDLEKLSRGDKVGSLSALSLSMQITNLRDQVLFERRGGIQLSAYLELPKASYLAYEATFSRFPLVGAADLLNDSKRIDRAARVATLPLVRTPTEISLRHDDTQLNTPRGKPLDLPPLPPAQAGVAESALLVPRDRILQTVHRVAVAPVDPGPFAVSAEVQKQLLRSLRMELAPLHWEVFEAPGARDLLAKAMRDIKPFDPLTGTRDDAKVSAARKSVFTALGMAPIPDAILWSDLVRVIALHEGVEVRWDGRSQNAYTLGSAERSPGEPRNIWELGSGGISAMSISVSLTDANDTLLYRARGGVQVLEKISMGTGLVTHDSLSFVPLGPADILNDYVREREAVEYALRALVLTPEALEAKMHPAKPGKGKGR
jgi:hypothetical protein